MDETKCLKCITLNSIQSNWKWKIILVFYFILGSHRKSPRVGGLSPLRLSTRSLSSSSVWNLCLVTQTQSLNSLWKIHLCGRHQDAHSLKLLLKSFSNQLNCRASWKNMTPSNPNVSVAMWSILEQQQQRKKISRSCSEMSFKNIYIKSTWMSFFSHWQTS